MAVNLKVRPYFTMPDMTAKIGSIGKHGHDDECEYQHSCLKRTGEHRPVSVYDEADNGKQSKRFHGYKRNQGDSFMLLNIRL